MRVGYLVPGVGLTDRERERRKRLLQQAAGEGITISLLEVDEGPAAIETAADEMAAVGPTLKLARTFQTEFDAFIIGCFGDVGIDTLRRNIAVPIIGPARSTYAIAAAMFPTFGILSLNSGFIEEEREIADRLGVLKQVAEIRALDLSVDTIIAAPQKALLRISERIGGMNAPAAVPGCMSMAFLLEEENLSEIRTIRIVNPLRCAIRTAVAMIA